MNSHNKALSGTILLDEIGEMSAALQAKLLHVLQDRQFTKLGSNAVIDVDVRVVAATNRDLEDMIKRIVILQDEQGVLRDMASRTAALLARNEPGDPTQPLALDSDDV